ncbi:DoxX-like protein [Terracoccus luteus]|uniref:DoxX-like protein n=1 Tax=Terracoccus luteus TaxID=53356 RepID=A0A495Y1P6_9MICO|nr:DoxX family membrane protein [Terracoccus luteus]RKT79114.1 DoxX-like protein [Terracoccus luteus]
MKLGHIVDRLPERLATGAFILHSGLEKLKGDEETAKGMHGMASGTFPFLKNIEPTRFLRMLAIGEITVGSLLLVPVVPKPVAGAALTGFSAALLTVYARTPGMRQPGSIWPTQQGLGVSKDVWMLGIGSGLMLDSATDRTRR